MTTTDLFTSYQDFLRQTTAKGLVFSVEARIALNGLMEWLCLFAEDADCPACLPKGAPTTQDLIADAESAHVS